MLFDTTYQSNHISAAQVPYRQMTRPPYYVPGAGYTRLSIDMVCLVVIVICQYKLILKLDLFVKTITSTNPCSFCKHCHVYHISYNFLIKYYSWEKGLIWGRGLIYFSVQATIHVCNKNIVQQTSRQTSPKLTRILQNHISRQK